MQLVDILETQLQNLLSDNSCEHALDHALRVLRNAALVGKAENADMFVLLPAAMLHDIALKKGTLIERNNKHALLGASMAKKVLQDIGYDNEMVERICSTIKQHSIDSPTDEPRTKEGDCLYDADKLDAVTPCGLARYLQERALDRNTPPVEAAKNYISLMYTFTFKTKTGKKLGEDRKIVIEICEQIISSGEIPSNN